MIVWALVALVAEFVVAAAAYALVVSYGAKRLRYRPTTVPAAVMTGALMVGSGVLLEAAVLFLPERAQWACAIAVWPVQWVVMGLLLMWLHQATWRGAAAGVAMLVAVQACLLAGAVLVVRPFVLEAETTHEEAMAPTLMGAYKVGTCPFCGGPLVVPVEPGADANASVLSTCEECWMGSLVAPAQVAGDVHPADRFVVMKLQPPDRWDLVLLHVGKERWVRRVVGIPGDTVNVDGTGEVINSSMGMAADPEGLRRRFPWLQRPGATTQKMPMQLGPGEYFVVADNSGNAEDSRTIGAVKRKDIEGVVSVLYWPMERARVFW